MLSAFCFSIFSCSFRRPRLSYFFSFTHTHDLHHHHRQHPKNNNNTTQVIGSIDGSGRIRLVDGRAPDESPAVDLDLEKVLGSMPNKTFSFDTLKRPLKALELPAGLTAQDALDKVLRLPSVCSKRFLTTKVDRHVTGESFGVFFLFFWLLRVVFVRARALATRAPFCPPHPTRL